MARQTTALTPFGRALRRWALRHRHVEEGIACEGTAIEKRTIKARKKAFLFLGPSDAMLKLRESVPEARKLAAKTPGRYKVGAAGWVTAKFADGAPATRLLEKWVDESYRIVVNGEPASKKVRK